jgi:hypothetical protein
MLLRAQNKANALVSRYSNGKCLMLVIAIAALWTLILRSPSDVE